MPTLSALADEQVDVAIVGGGIIGCGIARDAARRGLRVALFEKNDFGSGTTAASTRIVHGGLRYLEMLDLRLVRLDLRERETLLRIAPHLVRPLEFLIPFFAGHGVSSLKLRAGLALYDALSFDKSLPSRRWLAAAEARALDRALDRPDVRAAAAYHDARVDSPERLALENVIDAERHHAQAFNYCEVTGFTPGGDVGGVLHVRDSPGGGSESGHPAVEHRIRARVIVNATGAWFERAAERLLSRRPGVVRTTKGIHAVLPPLTDRALVLYSQVDARLLFAIPRRGLTWIGTTDTDYDGDPADARATSEDVEYLIASVRHLFPELRPDDVLYTTAGVRALVRQRGSESSVSRMHRIVAGPPLGPPGVISILGGKITGYRAIAEDATDAVCRRLGAGDRRATTAEAPLPGAASPVPGTVPPHLYELYGSRAADVLELAQQHPELQRPLAPAYPDIAAQVAYSVHHEHCVHLSDFLRRRSLLGASADQGLAAAEAVATVMGDALAWSADRKAREVEAYRHDVARTIAFRNEGDRGWSP